MKVKIKITNIRFYKGENCRFNNSKHEKFKSISVL